MGRTVKRLSGLEIDEVSLVDRPANQHGIVAIAKRQENTMSIFDAEGNEVEVEELQHGDFVYDDDGTELVFLEDNGEDNEPQEQYEYDDELESVGKASAQSLRTISGMRARALPGQVSEAGHRTSARARQLADRAKRKGQSASTAAGMQYRAIPQGGRTGLKYGATGTAAAGAGYGGGRRGTKAASLGDQVMESLSKALTDDDRSEVIAKAMDLVQDISDRNADLEDAVAQIQANSDVEGYYELAKGYELPVDPEEIAGIMYRASQTLPEDDVATLDRLFSSMGEVNKAYFNEIGYSGGYEAGALGEIYAAAGDVVSKSGGGLSPEQAVTALFDANPAAYDEYEAEQRYNR
jgi:hypothetical protein